ALPRGAPRRGRDVRHGVRGLRPDERAAGLLAGVLRRGSAVRPDHRGGLSMAGAGAGGERDMRRRVMVELTGIEPAAPRCARALDRFSGGGGPAPPPPPATP